MEQDITLQEAIMAMKYIDSLDTAWEWFLWIPLEFRIFVAAGLFGLLLIVWRFIWATMPYTD